MLTRLTLFLNTGVAALVLFLLAGAAGAFTLSGMVYGPDGTLSGAVVQALGNGGAAGETTSDADPPVVFPTRVMSFPSGRAESSQAVFFESFDVGNFEVGVKMVNGCGFPPGHPLHFYWVFYGGLTSAATQITVTQMTTGLEDEWINPARNLPLSVGRTQAFPCD